MNIKFNRNSFFKRRNDLDIVSIKKILNKLFLSEKINSNFFIKDISSTNNIKKHSILFFKENSLESSLDLNDVCVILDNQKYINTHNFINYILVTNLENTYNLLLNYLYIHEDNTDYIDDFESISNSYISKHSNIRSGTKLFNNCTIGKGVKIGKNCLIKNNVVIKNSIIGDNVTISDNTIIGSSGFGFDLKNMGSQNISPQIGIVYIDDNVHIGSNCTIDRGKIDFTYIGKNSMIDNMVHIGHNVILGKNACIAAQCGISGSVTIGDNLISGGQSGYAGHIEIGNNVVVAAKSGVTKNIKSNSTVAGFPAIDIRQWKKRIIRNKLNGYK